MNQTDIQPGKSSWKPGVFNILMLLLLLAAGWLFIRATPHGVGMVSDSVNYINGARSIAEGNGYYRASGDDTLKPITNFPPLYSMLLSLPILFGAEAFQSAWAFSLLFYLLNILLIALLIDKATANIWLGLGAAALFLASQPFLFFQVFAMTEPLFFFCTLSAFLLFLIAAKNDLPLIWLLSGIACGAAFLTRYIGVASLAAICAAILFYSPAKIRRLRAFLWTLAGALPLMAAWLVRNQLVTGNVSNRSAGVHPLGIADFKTGVMILLRWIYPERYQRVENPVLWMQALVLGLGVIGGLFLIIAWIRKLRSGESASLIGVLLWSFVIYIFAYLAVVYLTISFLDASVNVEERILYPCWMVLLLILFCLSGIFFRQRRKIMAILVCLGLFFLTVVSAQELARFVPRFSEEGYGWAWSGWEDSPAMNIIRSLPSDQAIYSNQPEAVSLWTGRGSYALLDPVDPSSDQIRPGYNETMQRIREQVIAGDSVLVFFGIGAWVENDPAHWIRQLTEDLPVIYQDSSEWVLGIKEN